MITFKQFINVFLIPELQLVPIIRRHGLIATKPSLYSSVALPPPAPAVRNSRHNPPATEVQRATVQFSPLAAGSVESADSETVWREARGELASLRGSAFREIEIELERLRQSASDGVEAVGSGYAFLLSGDAGTGKSALAAIFPRLLFGAGIVKSSAILDLHKEIPTGGEAGVWIADDADDVHGDPIPLAQVGRAFLRTNDKSSVAAMVLIGGPGFAERLARDQQASFWLMKCEIHDYLLPALSDDELMMVAEDIAREMGFALDSESHGSLRKVIARTRGNTRQVQSEPHR